MVNYQRTIIQILSLTKGSVMPYITDKEAKKFKELLDEVKRREKMDELAEKVFLSDLIERTKLTLLDLRKGRGPVEAYAIQFVKIMKKTFKEEKINIFWFNWKDFKEYVTTACLTLNNYGNIVLKKAFRERCRDYGIYTKILRKRGVIKVWEGEPVKRTKK